MYCQIKMISYRIAGKFGGDLIWRIGVRMKTLADFRISELDLATPQNLVPARVIEVTYKAPVTMLSSNMELEVEAAYVSIVFLSMFGLQQFATNYPAEEK